VGLYKYDDTTKQKGIDIHADKAAVNFNLWLGENESLEPDRGGLSIYTAKAPGDWDFQLYNQSPLSPESVQLLQGSGYSNITIPYKKNRMVMFDSNLFHVSDVVGWKPGYEKRRINLTLHFDLNAKLLDYRDVCCVARSMLLQYAPVYWTRRLGIFHTCTPGRHDTHIPKKSFFDTPEY
jgi:hypothetical protein